MRPIRSAETTLSSRRDVCASRPADGTRPIRAAGTGAAAVTQHLAVRADLAHEWNVPPREASSIQRRLAGEVRSAPDMAMPPRTVAGIYVGLPHGSQVAHAGVVVLALPGLQVVDRAEAEAPVLFPYVPGLLSFREAPAVLAALERLTILPDVLMFDGQGLAHPRRFGIASHVGVLLDVPSVGCAKSRLCGAHDAPPAARGGWAPLRDGDEIIGAVLRTRAHVRPVYVSIGHRIDLEGAIDLVLRCGAGYRLPEPIRLAHRLASGAN